jgi:hypothetical protein
MKKKRMFTELMDEFKRYHFRSTIVKTRLARKENREYVSNLLDAEYVYWEIGGRNAVHTSLYKIKHM